VIVATYMGKVTPGVPPGSFANLYPCSHDLSRVHREANCVACMATSIVRLYLLRLKISVDDLVPRLVKYVKIGGEIGHKY
jgi:hypothetical protein